MYFSTILVDAMHYAFSPTSLQDGTQLLRNQELQAQLNRLLPTCGLDSNTTSDLTLVIL